MRVRKVYIGGCAALAIVYAATLAPAQPPVAKPVDPPGTARPGTGPASQAPAAPVKVQPPAAKPAGPRAAGQAPAVAKPATPAPAGEPVPTDASLGIPIFPTAQFITSYDAGQGQRFYLFGTTASFAEMVAYYRTVLKQKGELVFDVPATHMFEVGKYKDTEVAFPPGVTIKDYAGNGMTGFTNPTPGGSPGQFRTIIQIVPGPPGMGGRPR